MKKIVLFFGLALVFAAQSLDDEVIKNIDFLESMDMLRDEETFLAVQEEGPETFDQGESNEKP